MLPEVFHALFQSLDYSLLTKIWQWIIPRLQCKAHGGCGRSAGNPYSSWVPNHTLVYVDGSVFIFLLLLYSLLDLTRFIAIRWLLLFINLSINEKFRNIKTKCRREGGSKPTNCYAWLKSNNRKINGVKMYNPIKDAYFIQWAAGNGWTSAKAACSYNQSLNQSVQRYQTSTLLNLFYKSHQDTAITR
jgi:hypothetical protein